MTLGQWIMRLLAPACERQRMELRKTVARANAHAEDLTRTVVGQQPFVFHNSKGKP